MSFTSHYLETIETLMGQGNESVLVRNERSCLSCSQDLVILNYWSPLSTINWRVPD